jgi:hypothetical protein
MIKVAGYCKLCREKELELYGDIISQAGPRHTAAVREAGCRHPADYSVEGTFTAWKKDQEVTARELETQFGDRYYHVLRFRLRQLPGTGERSRPRYAVREDLPATQAEYRQLHDRRFTTTVETLIGDAFSVIDELAGEMREAYDNTPDNLKEAALGCRRGEAASTLEDLAADVPDIPEECGDIDVIFLPRLDRNSRAKRAADAAAMLYKAAEGIHSYLKENEGEEGDASELAELAGELQEVSDELAGVDFPGMYR